MIANLLQKLMGREKLRRSFVKRPSVHYWWWFRSSQTWVEDNRFVIFFIGRDSEGLSTLIPPSPNYPAAWLHGGTTQGDNSGAYLYKAKMGFPDFSNTNALSVITRKVEASLLGFFPELDRPPQQTSFADFNTLPFNRGCFKRKNWQKLFLDCRFPKGTHFYTNQTD